MPTSNENFDILISSTSPSILPPTVPSIPPPTVPIFPSFTTPWETPLDYVSESENDIAEPSATSLDSLPSPSSEPPQISEVITRSGRRVRRNPRYFNDLHANAAFLRTFSSEVNLVDAKHLLQTNNQVKPKPFAFISESLIGMATSSDTDTMTLDEVMAAPD